jgi:tetratricopeptide (TPR) repeat protein
MFKLLLLAGAAAAAPVPPSLSRVDRITEAQHAISVGRLDQARAMISKSIAQGGQGEAVDRLLAELAYAEGKSEEALERYKLLLGRHPTDVRLAERAAISALKAGNIGLAKGLADHATSLPKASWRAWNARGVAADLNGDFEAADVAYERALALAPDRAEVLTNVGWSKLLRGDWNGAIAPLEQAAELMPSSARAANNLELARAALANHLPQRRPGESDDDWAARLNDAGVAARLRGENARAVAAFSQAIEARTSWYARAANNLSAVSGKR